MRVLVMGASGQIGQFLLPRLTAAGMEYDTGLKDQILHQGSHH